MTYLFILTNALYEENTELRLSVLDFVEQFLATLDGAVGRIKNANGSALLEKVNKELLECLHSNLLSNLRGSSIIGVEEYGGLIHAFRSRLHAQLRVILLSIGNCLLGSGVNAVQKDVGGLGRCIDSLEPPRRTRDARLRFEACNGTSDYSSSVAHVEDSCFMLLPG